MTFLTDNSAFVGTGERNQEGQTLEEFLEAYDPKKYDSPSNTTDIVVVRTKEALTHWGQPMQVLLIKRANHPNIGMWAAPGGFVELKEDLFQGAARELEEETGIKNLPLKQMATWGQWNRDPRWRVITTSFLALVEGNLSAHAGDDAAQALWMDVKLTQEEPGDGRDAQVWNLELEGRHGQIQVGARVAITQTGSQLLSQDHYHLIESRGLAADHGCLIVQALLYLKERLNRD